MWAKNKQSGFTIVELLIVIVVIGVLAAITIVTYSGIQDRARYAAYRSDIESMNKAILLYYIDNGTYPVTGCITNGATGTGDFIPGLVPKYLPKIPPVPNWLSGTNYYAYCASAGGVDYKVLRLVTVAAGSVPAVELSGNQNIDPVRGNRAWGYWSTDGSGL